MKILEARQKAGLSQTQVCDKVGITQPHLSNLERGQRSVSGLRFDKLTALCTLLKYPGVNTMIEENKDGTA